MADGGSRQERTRLSTSEFQWMLLLVIGGVVAGIVGALVTSTSYPEISRLFSVAAITLLFGSLLGGVVTLLIGDFDRRRAQRAAQMDFIANVLSDLKGVYDRVDRARTLIKASRSATTYGEEMRHLIEARVMLKNVKRALKTDERGTKIAKVLAKVKRMDAYLRKLLDEYEDHYREISLQQSIFEAQLKRSLEPPASGHALAMLPRNVPWEKIEGLERMKDLLAVPVVNAKPNSGYAREFIRSLDGASKTLRAALAEQLKQAR